MVLAAYERLKIFPPSLGQKHMSSARREMNLLLAEAANKQVNLWKVDEVTTTLVSGQSTYDVDPSTIMMLDAWITTNPNTSQAVDLFITPVSRTEYASFSSKSTPGRPTCFWFDRLINPTVTLWPVPNVSGYQLGYYRVRQMEDANLRGGETPDIPYRWYDWFVAGLAHRLSRTYATPEVEKMRKADAVEAWTIAAAQDTENVPLTLAPTITTYYRRR